ncbi:Uncharacterised protein [Burkholderia pseudomallei]|nr:hypothetical protein BURPSS13_G0082 [Burkholderia pseudomallei S13]CAJ3839201.1 Uncharacterised protein [Burkholderia pseudomallei]CAJ4600893.1 Uncharacterised protein [Burkholderia pseudomallei]CAJ4739692.1 Uncharacterised protein [Burkholderia pseudomallei]CAJ7270988.1 Uncharacterised protein [Burkholderia pseudomallei]
MGWGELIEHDAMPIDRLMTYRGTEVSVAPYSFDDQRYPYVNGQP